MILRPVVMLLPPDETLSGLERVERQRRVARIALSRSAALSGVPDGPWLKGPDEAPLPCNGYHWSIAHTRTAVAGVVADRPVGIDIERLEPRRAAHYEAVAAEEEWQLVGGRTWPAYLRVWTAKEAALKAYGAGIGELRACRILAMDSIERCSVQFREGTWRVAWFAFAEHIAAVTESGSGIEWQTEPPPSV